ncbi:MAG: hypothetical protein IJA73_01485 [Oscillospiraceae bacterium]|nr:hypothetical protein [Oscillospiraceae bacterium]
MGRFRRSGGELLFCSRPKKKPKNTAQKPAVSKSVLVTLPDGKVTRARKRETNPLAGTATNQKVTEFDLMAHYNTRALQFAMLIFRGRWRTLYAMQNVLRGEMYGALQNSIPAVVDKQNHPFSK